MRSLAQALWVLVVLTHSAYGAFIELGRADPLPDVIIGNPYNLEADILGDPITEEDVQAALKLTITEPEEDPISMSGYFEGDIMLETEDELIQLIRGDSTAQNSAVRDWNFVWPNGIIHYVISQTYNNTERSIIARAMLEITQKTCLDFVPREYEYNYIHIYKGRGCSSRVGMLGGQQSVVLGGGCMYVGVVMHELIHAAGFWHEQSRHDRDSYVTILWRNIKYGTEHNFEKNSNHISTDLGLPYDYDSIMHYKSDAFSWNREHTIIPNKRGVLIGQRERLSKLDVKGINLLYNCPNFRPACEDYKKYCPYLGILFCNVDFIYTNCRKTCGLCDPVISRSRTRCQDYKPRCQTWAMYGACETDPSFMQVWCQRTCNLC